MKYNRVFVKILIILFPIYATQVAVLPQIVLSDEIRVSRTFWVLSCFLIVGRYFSSESVIFSVTVVIVWVLFELISCKSSINTPVCLTIVVVMNASGARRQMMMLIHVRVIAFRLFFVHASNFVYRGLKKYTVITENKRIPK